MLHGGMRAGLEIEYEQEFVKNNPQKKQK